MTPSEPTIQPSGNAAAAAASCAPQYEIRISGHLGPRWAAWFEGLELSLEEGGVTLISGPIADQAALHGLLAKLRDLGIPLVSLLRRPTGAIPNPSASNPSAFKPSASDPAGAPS